MGVASAQEVVRFWREAGPERWFKKDSAFDAEIRRRFYETHEAAAAGKLKAWEETAEGALGLLILLDQFPRNLFRDDPRAFATDRARPRGHGRRADQGLRRAGEPGHAQLLLSAVPAFGRPRRPGTRRGALSRGRRRRRPEMGRPSTPTSSASSDAFRIATLCSDERRRRRSRSSWMTAASPDS